MRWIFIGFISIYQGLISAALGQNCRFAPSCSEYTKQALLYYGLWDGGLLALRRILRCHPWGKSGLDPVPKKIKT